MNITKASEVLGFRVEYLRKLVKDGKIKPELVAIKEGKTPKRYEFTEEMLDAFKKLPRHQIRRADGRSKYLVYLNSEELEVIRKVLPEHVDSDLLKRAPTHKPKPKPSLPKAE